MSENQICKENIWKIGSFVLIGLILGYIIGRFELSTIKFKTNTATKKTIITNDEQDSTNNKNNEDSTLREISVDDDDFIGEEDAKVLIVDFSEYQCPFCAKMYSEIYPKLKRDFIDTGKVKYVFRDFPLKIHSNAINAAMAAECAGDQNKYFQMHDILLESQIDWKELENPKAKFIEYASKIDINIETFENCYDEQKHLDEINKDKNEAVTYGVRSTPTLFVNGKMLRGVPNNYSQLKSIIEAELY